ncbi:MAG: hypothetical protein ABIG43_05115 [Chloroflexota bacterium]
MKYSRPYSRVGKCIQSTILVCVLLATTSSIVEAKLTEISPEIITPQITTTETAALTNLFDNPRILSGLFTVIWGDGPEGSQETQQTIYMLIDEKR